MQRDDAHLLDILQSARLARQYVEGLDRESFMREPQVQDAVIRRLEIIGEAARRVSDETRMNLPGLPWREMIGMRNRLIHQYDFVSLAIVWEVTQDDLPPLIVALTAVLPPDKP